MAHTLPVVIVETRAFTARIGDLFDHEQYRRLQMHLLRHPTAGSLIPGTGGLRKIRWSASGRGKRGGARVIYFPHQPSNRLLMLFAFAKNEQSDLTAKQMSILRNVVETEYPK